MRDTCALPLTYRTNFFLFEVFVFECSPLFRCYIIHLYFMRRRHRWALSTTEFIMFAFLLLHSELMFVGEIRIFDENLCSPVVFFFVLLAHLPLAIARACCFTFIYSFTICMFIINYFYLFIIISRVERQATSDWWTQKVRARIEGSIVIYISCVFVFPFVQPVHV